MKLDNLQVGQRIKVVQTTRRREGDWRHEVTGTVVEAEAHKTGSWYAHAKDARYWLRRIRLQKDDGELSTVTVDQSTEIELLDADTPAAT